MSIQAFAASLVGNKCATVIGGAGSGSILALGFGKKLRRVKPLTNPMLSEDDKRYASELELTIYCAWRLRDDSEVLCGWRDASDERSWELLRRLVGRTVRSAVVEPRTQDLALNFEADIALEIFCDITSSYEAQDNYTFADRERIEAVGARSVVVEPADRRRILSVVTD